MANAFGFIDFKKLVPIPKIIILCTLLVRSSNCNSLCSPQFCESYLANESCLALPDACKIQNSTNNGIFLPSPGPCNCCEYCLENLGANEQCAIGDPSSPSPNTICGAGLTCTMKTDLPTCQQMTTPCTLEQLAYDSKVNDGKVGHLERRTDCDRNGMYKPYKCVPGEICFCVSAEGDRIFGEVLFTPAPYFSLSCECSRMFNKAMQIENRYLKPSEYFRCQSNGDYDVLQCIDDKCFCVDADNGHLTYPDLDPVNITSVSQSTLPCFNNETHEEAEYYRVCEAMYVKALNTSKFYQVNGYHVLGSILPNCQLDGLYAPVQENITHKYCSDTLGNQLENFAVIKTNTMSLNMTCNCARVSSMSLVGEKPECCINGNYKQVQRRRGLCRCVDSNGVQIEKEVDCTHVNQLSCFNNTCKSE